MFPKWLGGGQVVSFLPSPQPRPLGSDSCHILGSPCSIALGPAVQLPRGPFLFRFSTGSF